MLRIRNVQLSAQQDYAWSGQLSKSTVENSDSAQNPRSMSVMGIFQQLLWNVTVVVFGFCTVEVPSQQPDKSIDGKEQHRDLTMCWGDSCTKIDSARKICAVCERTS